VKHSIIFRRSAESSETIFFDSCYAKFFSSLFPIYRGLSLEIDESRFREWEIYSKESVKAPLIVRLDGKNFRKLAGRCGFTKPFDERFHLAMMGTAEDLMTETGLNIPLVHTASDEFSLLFSRDTHLPFRGRIEKILSILSSYASSSLQNRLRESFSHHGLISFDARIVKVHMRREILEYFSWRCLESFRNFLNSYAQSLIGRRETFRMKGEEIVKELRLRGFDIHKAPQWQKYGTLIYWGQAEKRGYNPMTGEEVTVKRRRICMISIDPSSPKGRRELETLLQNI